MPGENALEINARVFDPGNQVIAEHAGFVAHPGEDEFFRFLAEGWFHQAREGWGAGETPV